MKNKKWNNTILMLALVLLLLGLIAEEAWYFILPIAMIALIIILLLDIYSIYISYKSKKKQGACLA